MDPIQNLLGQIRRKQLLVCAYGSGDGEPPVAPTLADFTALLNIESADCLRLAHRLHGKHLIEPVLEGELSAVKLTQRGERLVQRMSRVSDLKDEQARH